MSLRKSPTTTTDWTQAPCRHARKSTAARTEWGEAPSRINHLAAGRCGQLIVQRVKGLVVNTCFL